MSLEQTPLPEEISEFIKKGAYNRFPDRYSFNGQRDTSHPWARDGYKDGAEAMYHHLSSLIAELEGEVERLKAEVGNKQQRIDTLNAEVKLLNALQEFEEERDRDENF
jgi:hypothetical protein